MKKLSKANGLFLFYLVANKSENHFLSFQVSLDQNNLNLCQKYHKFRLLSISYDDFQRHLLMFVTKSRQKATSLWQNRGAAASLKFKADALSW